jgi:glycosyltransferase involved in cell wall biosynthesis
VPLVSVIIPAYNVEPYIAAAIESALEQTFGDYEIVVVDDGSTDRTGAIAAAYAARSARIRLVRQVNRGLSAARNAALREARGAFFALLDGDDIWDPNFLEQQMAVFRARPDVSIVTGNATCLGSWRDGQPAQPYPDLRPEPTLITVLEDERAVFVMSVFRRRVYETIGGFDEALRTNEDYDYWIRAAATGFIFARNDQPLGRYRRRDDSLSACDVRMLSGILKVFAKNRPLFDGRPAELAALDRQVRRFELALLGAQARAAIERSDFETAATNLDAMHARCPGALLAMARLMAHWSPVLLSRAYGFRRTRRVLGAHLPS